VLDALVPICTGPSSARRFTGAFSWQTNAFNAYTEVCYPHKSDIFVTFLFQSCRKAGIKTKVPSVKIADMRRQLEKRTSHASSSGSSEESEKEPDIGTQLVNQEAGGDALGTSDGSEDERLRGGTLSADVGKTSPGIPPPQIPDASYTPALGITGKSEQAVDAKPQNGVGPPRRGRFRRFFKKLAFWA